MLLFCYVFPSNNNYLASRAYCISRHFRLLLSHALTQTHSLSLLPALSGFDSPPEDEPSTTMYKSQTIDHLSCSFLSPAMEAERERRKKK